jgi:hypothetical protein
MVVVAAHVSRCASTRTALLFPLENTGTVLGSADDDGVEPSLLLLLMLLLLLLSMDLGGE